MTKITNDYILSLFVICLVVLLVAIVGIIHTTPKLSGLSGGNSVTGNAVYSSNHISHDICKRVCESDECIIKCKKSIM